MEFDDMLLRIGEILHETIRRNKEAALGSAAPDVTLSQLAYLEAINNMSEPTLSALSARLRVTKASASAGIAILEQHELIRRHRSDDDRRVQYIELSAAGRELIDAEAASFRELANNIAEVLSSDENHALRSILTKIINANGG